MFNFSNFVPLIVMVLRFPTLIESTEKLGHFVSNLVTNSPQLSKCSVLLVTPFDQNMFDLSPLLYHLSSRVIPSFHGGLVAINGSDGDTIFGPLKFDIYFKRRQNYCSVILAFFSSEAEFDPFYGKVVTSLPTLVKKDEDFFVLVGNSGSVVERALSSENLGERIKHRAGLVVGLEFIEGRTRSCFRCGAGLGIERFLIWGTDRVELGGSGDESLAKVAN